MRMRYDWLNSGEGVHESFLWAPRTWTPTIARQACLAPAGGGSRAGAQWTPMDAPHLNPINLTWPADVMHSDFQVSVFGVTLRIFVLNGVESRWASACCSNIIGFALRRRFRTVVGAKLHYCKFESLIHLPLGAGNNDTKLLEASVWPLNPAPDEQCFHWLKRF